MSDTDSRWIVTATCDTLTDHYRGHLEDAGITVERNAVTDNPGGAASVRYEFGVVADSEAKAAAAVTSALAGSHAEVVNVAGA